MSNFLTASAITMFVILVLGGIFTPEASYMWLASTESYFIILRLVVIVMLTALLVTSPPRSRNFRAIIGGVAMIMVGTIWAQLSMHSLMLLDALTFLQAAVILGIASIEPSDSTKTVHTATR